jgi:arabinosaccharide transport system substrate-binding protein
MKKKLLSVLLCMTLVATMFVGCGKDNATEESADTAATEDAATEDATTEDTTTEDAATEETAEVEATAVTTVGPDDATHLEMWSFVELHNTFYAEMLELWNEKNPDKQLNITFTTYPYSDMHNKLTLANQAGTGAPDLCDVEISQFPNYLIGDVQFRALNDVIEPYQADTVQARLDIYSKDGNYYGVPTHVGATVMFYNTKVLEQYGIDYTKIVTWDDYTAAAKTLFEASNGEVTMMTVDTGGTDWLWLAMAEYGQDYTTAEGAPDIELESIKNMLALQQGWLNDGIAVVSPGGQLDTTEGYVVHVKILKLHARYD